MIKDIDSEFVYVNQEINIKLFISQNTLKLFQLFMFLQTNAPLIFPI